MTDLCLFGSFFCIPSHIVIGVFLIILGVIISVIGLYLYTHSGIKIAKDLGNKIGIILVILGFVISVGVSIVGDLWENNIWFKYGVYSFFVLLVVITILFSDRTLIKSKNG